MYLKLDKKYSIFTGMSQVSYVGSRMWQIILVKEKQSPRYKSPGIVKRSRIQIPPCVNIYIYIYDRLDRNR